MARTIRVLWKNATTGWRNYNWNGLINMHSTVHISACEAVHHRDSFDHKFGISRVKGAAQIEVKNIRPHPPNPGDDITGGVEFFLVVDWKTPLNVCTDITVFDVPEDFHVIE